MDPCNDFFIALFSYVRSVVLLSWAGSLMSSISHDELLTWCRMKSCAIFLLV